MLKSIRNSLVATSVLYVAVGLVLILFPGSALKLACMLIGGVTMIYGVVKIISYWRGKNEYVDQLDLVVGVLLAGVGIFLLICPNFLADISPIALGLYLLVDSFNAVKQAFSLRKARFDKWWVSFLLALLLAAFGVVMIRRAFQITETFVVFIGIAFLFDGVYTLANTVAADRFFQKDKEE